MMRSGDPFDPLELAVDLFEVALLAGAVALTAFASVEARAIRLERKALIRDLADARREGERWRMAARTHLEGLSRAISEKFAAWDLNGSEAEVAGPLLKGFSHREIADPCGCAPATARQHAASVYRKSGLSSRAQLTAFFLEDLLAPDGGATSVAALPRRTNAS